MNEVGLGDNTEAVFVLTICTTIFHQFLKLSGGFPGGAVVKNPPANAGDTGSSPGPGRSHMPRSN